MSQATQHRRGQLAPLPHFLPTQSQPTSQEVVPNKVPQLAQIVLPETVTTPLGTSQAPATNEASPDAAPVMRQPGPAPAMDAPSASLQTQPKKRPKKRKVALQSGGKAKKAPPPQRVIPAPTPVMETRKSSGKKDAIQVERAQVKTNIALPVYVHEKLREASFYQRRSIRSLMLDALNRLVDEKGTKLVPIHKKDLID